MSCTKTRSDGRVEGGGVAKVIAASSGSALGPALSHCGTFLAGAPTCRAKVCFSEMIYKTY